MKKQAKKQSVRINTTEKTGAMVRQVKSQFDANHSFKIPLDKVADLAIVKGIKAAAAELNPMLGESP
jgi:hypothetical protein